MGQVILKKIGVLFVLICLAMTIAITFSAYSYADAEATGDEEEITVFFTVNDEKGYLVGNDDAHTVMYRVPVKLKYVNLADYGLEKYYRYKAKSFEEGGDYLPEAIENKDVVKQPTVLMLYLKVLSKYYLNREITKADIGDTELKALVPANQAPTSFFMNFFWNHGENLLYYVNHEYPLMHEGWGATADYILLDNGDDVEVQLMPGSEINSFQKFETEEMTVTQGTEISSNLQRLGSNIYTGSGTVSYPLPDYYIRYSMDYGKTWTATDIQSDDNGDFTFTPETAGVCYMSTSQYKSSVSWHCGLPTSIIHVTPEQIQNTDCYMTLSDEIVFTFDEVKGAEGYNIWYREQGASEWSRTAVDTNEFILTNAKAGIAYEFKASAYVTDKYVLPDEPYTTLTGEESDVVTYSMTDDPAVLNVIEKMALVPDAADVQLSDREKIEDARSKYDALTADQKQHIAPSDVTKLEAAEERLAELQAGKEEQDKKDAAAVTNMITALPSVNNVTYDSRDQVLAAYDAYEALSPEGKAMVMAISVSKLNNLKEKIDAWDVDAVRTLIDNLPKPSAVILTDKERISEAKSAYDRMSDAAKEMMPASYKTRLNTLVAKIADLEEKDAKARKAAKEVTDMISALPTADGLALTDKELVSVARKAYDALDNDAKAFVSDATTVKLTTLEARLIELEKEKQEQDQKGASTVEKMISELPESAALKLDDKYRVSKAQEAYYALDNTAMALVSEAAKKKLDSLMVRIGELEKQNEEDIEAVLEVLNKTSALPDEFSVTTADKETVQKVQAAYNALSDNAKAMVPASASDKLRKIMDRINELEKQAEAEKEAAEKAAKEAAEKAEKEAAEKAAEEAKAAKEAADKAVKEAEERAEREKEEEENAKAAAVAAAKKLRVRNFKVKAKGRKFILTWKKNKIAAGYQIQYTLKTKKAFKNLKKAITKTKVKTIKLKKGNKYIFRIRPYKVIDGEKVYGKWVKSKAVKCK